MADFDFPEIQSQTLAVKLTATGERKLRDEHPWIFSESIEKLNKEGNSGDIAVIFSHRKNKAIGVGLFDPDSPIRIKMLHHHSGAKIDSEFFQKKIQKAFANRNELLATHTNAYRLLFGENDGFPGCIADVYAKVLVVKLYSAIWMPYLKVIVNHLVDVSSCETVVLRLSRKLQKSNKYSLQDGMVIQGMLAEENVHFVEHDVQFSANVIKGHKTGFFLDHRANRDRVGKASKGKSVLDVFSYAGGFSVHALANGAKEVTSVDISEQALELAIANGKLNAQKGKHKVISGDVFQELPDLIREQKRFEVVIIDPPSFAKREQEIDLAKKKYAQLANLGRKLVTKNGLLVLASCSSRITKDEFFAINAEVFVDQQVEFTLEDSSQHDIDHPISFPEAAYLKCGYYRIS
jgi:23S rRNA (cytosine1962-C5)-methyltransferase